MKLFAFALKSGVIALSTQRPQRCSRSKTGWKKLEILKPSRVGPPVETLRYEDPPVAVEIFRISEPSHLPLRTMTQQVLRT
jgi:hypothetical protein